MLLHVRIANVLLDRHALNDPHAAEELDALLREALNRAAGERRRHVLVRRVSTVPSSIASGWSLTHAAVQTSSRAASRFIAISAIVRPTA